MSKPASCNLTRTDSLGPYFEKNAPKSYAIAPSDELNDPEMSAVIKGKVLDRACKPITDAVVDVFFCGGRGKDGEHSIV